MEKNTSPRGQEVDIATAEVGAKVENSPPSSLISPDHGSLILYIGLTSTMSTPDVPPGPSAPGETATIHPIVRNALRISLSVKEYRTLHDVVVQRAPSLKDKLPSPSHYETMASPKSRHTEAALRASLRVFVGSGIAMKLVEVVMKRIRGVTTKYEQHE